ncbi:MAG: selenium-dependent molybdenum cofactor biosynthesis protein YqeB [Desulfatiglandales bacterium]
MEKGHPWCHTVMVRGGGDMASGVILRLHRAGFKVFFTELRAPLAVRRKVSFSEAVYDGRAEVEGVEAVLLEDPSQVMEMWERKKIPCFVDEKGGIGGVLKPDILIDATMAKKNLGTSINDAQLVIGLGPGFEAGKDVHLVVETKRGHTLGRVIEKGSALPNTGEPEPVLGHTHDRVLRASADGIWRPFKEIGEKVERGELVGEIEGRGVRASISGTLRGLIRAGIRVTHGLKIGDIDPRGQVDYAFTVSDKALAISGGVLEAILMWCSRDHSLSGYRER